MPTGLALPALEKALTTRQTRAGPHHPRRLRQPVYQRNLPRSQSLSSSQVQPTRQPLRQRLGKSGWSTLKTELPSYSPTLVSLEKALL
jgi:hypothetical protein